MTAALVAIRLDRDLAGHLAVALRRHRGQLAKLGAAEPPALRELEDLAISVTKRHEASHGVTVTDLVQDEDSDRGYLSRRDVQRLTGASLSTIDRWIASGELPSTRHGRIRRIRRADLERFHQAA